MRVLVVSDIHGNLPALESVMSHAGTVDAVWNLGDTVGYGPWPNECIDLVNSHASSVHLAGNHDLAAIGAIATDGFNPIAAKAAHWTAKSLTPGHRGWLQSLSSLTIQNNYTLAHGSPRSPVFEYILTSSAAAQNFAFFETPVCLVGHTHVPMIAVDGISMAVERPFMPTDGQSFGLSAVRSIINPGSAGQPRDGDPGAAYAVLDIDRKTIEFRRAAYPFTETQKAIMAAGLPRQLAGRLAVGR